jgi:C-terminal processing protease CtpA/Prc
MMRRTIRASMLLRFIGISMTLLFSTADCNEPAPIDQRQQAFDRVWMTINESFYDDTFGGRDWRKIAEKYRHKVIHASTDKDFFVGLNTMLFELRVSHIGVIPDEHPEWIGAPSSFAGGEVGLDIRIISDQMVVTRRSPKLGRQVPDLRPGTVITAINGLRLADFIAAVSEPPVPAIPQLMLATERAARELYRDPGETVEILYLSDSGEERSASVTAFTRGSAIEIIEGIPPVYVDFEARLLEPNIGYIRFNSFHPTLTDRIVSAIDDFRDSAGIILDVRGNSGGDFTVRRAIVESVIQKRTLVWEYHNRFGVDEIILDPIDNPYSGPLVVLVDELSASSAEELAGALQALGRATVIGNPTAGLVLVAAVERLEIGATLVYPSAQTRFVNGFAPEGKGIMPDIIVAPDISRLRNGVDVPLDTAITLVLRGRKQVEKPRH